MRIRVIAPVTAAESLSAFPGACADKVRQDTKLSIVNLERGPASIECLYEEALAAPGVIQRALEAERDGADAVVVDCMNDPGLEAAREAVSIPVVGAAQSAMLMASIVAHRFSIIGTAARDVYPCERLVRRYGLATKYASTRWVDIPVLDLGRSRDRLLSALVEESVQAIARDGAQAIVFGCTLMSGLGGAVRARLREGGFDAAVIDPSFAALKWAELLVDLGLSSSRRVYPPYSRGTPGGQVSAGKTAVPETGGRLEKAPRIQVLVPVTLGFRDEHSLEMTEREYCSHARPGCELRASAIEHGPATLEAFMDEALAIPEMLRLARRAEEEGATALVLDCMLDPGLDAIRERVDIPVVGPGQTSYFVAASLAHRFSILGTRLDTKRKFLKKIEEYGLGSQLASIRDIDMSVQELEEDPGAALDALVREAELAVVEDDAQVVVPGCTGMIGLAARLRSELLAKGLDVPVLEPPAVAVKMAEALVDLGLTQSKITYPNPPEKALAGYEELEIRGAM